MEKIIIFFKEINACKVEVVCNDIRTIQYIITKLKAKKEGAEFSQAYKSGIWDGYKNFYTITKEKTLLIPRGCVEKLIQHLNSLNKYKIISDIQYKSVPLENMQDLNNYINNELKLDISAYDYQIQAVYDNLINNIQTNILATSSGKSLIIYIIVRFILDKLKQDNKKILIIVPTISLLSQILNDFISYGMRDTEHIIKLIGGKFKDKTIGDENIKIIISTWQSIAKCDKKDFYPYITHLVEDECHRAVSNTHTSHIFPYLINAYFRFGFTGTIKNSIYDKLTLLNYFGPIKKYITPSQLIEKNLATPIQIQPLLIYHDIYQNINTYEKEQKYLINENFERNLYIIQYIKNNLKGNTLILFRYLKHGEILLNQYLNLCNIPFNDISDFMNINEYNIFYITGEMKSDNRENIRNHICNSYNNIIFGSISIMSTGINIPTLNNIVLISGGKSYITINQSIGRLIRKHHSKDIVTMYDCVDIILGTHNYMLKHYEQRVKIYKEHNYKILNPITF